MFSYCTICDQVGQEQRGSSFYESVTVQPQKPLMWHTKIFKNIKRDSSTAPRIRTCDSALRLYGIETELVNRFCV